MSAQYRAVSETAFISRDDNIVSTGVTCVTADDAGTAASTVADLYS
jgi:hypothetical protein